MTSSDFQQSVEEYAQASLYRHYHKVYEKNHRGPIRDNEGRVTQTVRLTLLIGFGLGLVTFGYGILQGRRGDFIAGIGFLPMLVCGVWLLIRWNSARKARKGQLEILAWFKSKKVPFPYQTADEIIDPLERIDWEVAHRHDALKRALGDLAERNWDDALIVARRSAALPLFGRMMIEKARWEEDLWKKQATLVKLLEDPAAFGLEREELLAVFPLVFFDWEARPVIMQGYYRAWAILRNGGGWVPVSVLEVIDSGHRVSPNDFDEVYPGVPPLPFPH